MPGLESFVKGNRNGRPGSPQNEQPPVNPQRQAFAANLKVPMRPGLSRPPTAQESSARSEAVAQHQSATLQQHLQRRPSGEGRKHDPYDTDADESLDTTTNQSVIQVENTPPVDQQQLQPDHVHTENGDEEEASEEDDDDGESEFEFDENISKLLSQNHMADASYEDQMQFLQQTQPHLFRTIDGDSYPTTTDGNPTEWDEQQEPPFDDLGSPSPSHQRPQQGPNAPVFNQQSLRQMHAINAQQPNPTVPPNSRIWQQGAHIRGQQRTDGAAHARGHSGQHNTAHLPSSQLPTYSQANREQDFVAPSAPPARPEATTQSSHGGPSQRSSRLPPGPGRTENPVPRIAAPAAPVKHASTTHAKVAPIVQQHVELAPIEEPPALLDGDYDTDVLFKMDFNQLRDESFDQSPRDNEPVVPEEMREKPLEERLQFAQRNLDSAAQSQFFSALSTNEWEDAGDWFLDQFSKIIKKTREARQKKRKEAQGYEQEIEERHKHVAKKQRLVEGAMAKMKTQGEGLVPKSPRASKSPRPRRT
jgi:hypothetical protein